jgi:hypothetical protein
MTSGTATAIIPKQDPMTLISLKFTSRELELLSSLAADQLFRREFIDPRMPGYKPNPGDLSLGKKLVERLRMTVDRANKDISPPKRNGAVRAPNAL